MATRHSIRKRMRKVFRLGDVATFGRGVIAHRVVEVTRRAVIVDSTSANFGRLRNGRLTMLIEFAPGSRSHRCPGPPRHTTMVPDKVISGLAR